MTTDKHAEILRKIQELNILTVNQLREKWVEVWNEPCRSRNKNNLRKRIAWRIQALAFGGLSERAVERARELADETLLKTRNPGVQHTGNPSVHRFAPVDDPQMPMPGGMLTRKYRGRDIVVWVLDENRGFEFGGQNYKSLSAVAKAITGAHCNGRAFFGLPKTKEAA